MPKDVLKTQYIFVYNCITITYFGREVFTGSTGQAVLVAAVKRSSEEVIFFSQSPVPLSFT